MSQAKNILNIFEVIFLRFPLELCTVKESASRLISGRQPESKCTENWLATSTMLLSVTCNIYELENKFICYYRHLRSQAYGLLALIVNCQMKSWCYKQHHGSKKQDTNAFQIASKNSTLSP